MILLNVIEIFLRNLQTIFQSNCTILHSYQQCMQTLVSLYPFQCLLLSVLLIIAILLGVKWYFIVVFKKYLFILIFTFFGYVGS